MVHREPERAALSTRNAMKYRLILCSFLPSCSSLTILSRNIIRDHTIDDLGTKGEILSNLYSFSFSLCPDCYSISFTFSSDGGQFGTLRVTWFEPCQRLWYRNRAERKWDEGNNQEVDATRTASRFANECQWSCRSSEFRDYIGVRAPYPSSFPPRSV